MAVIKKCENLFHKTNFTVSFLSTPDNKKKYNNIYFLAI